MLSFSIGLIVLIVGLERVGNSLIPIVAGLGIGGVALVGQRTAENVIAGLLLSQIFMAESSPNLARG